MGRVGLEDHKAGEAELRGHRPRPWAQPGRPARMASNAASAAWRYMDGERPGEDRGRAITLEVASRSPGGWWRRA